MIYLDNAATTYPKPDAVIKAMQESLKIYGANPGRSGYTMANETAEQIYNVRLLLSDFFDLNEPEHVIFTKNCTEALNIVIHGLANKGCEFVCSDIEHNSVVRPLAHLEAHGICKWKTASITFSKEQTIKNFKEKINENTRAIICTAMSNVFGIVTPLKELSTIAHENGCFFIVDAAQGAGVLPLSMKNQGIDFLCIPGHKGLYGPMGTGALLIHSKIQELDSFMQGGTGTSSFLFTQPKAFPESLESGTINVPGILALGEGIKFLNKISALKAFRHEFNCIRKIYHEMKSLHDIILYQNFDNETEMLGPILSFNLKNLHSETAASLLAKDGIAVRGGYQCAPMAHMKFNTEEKGTVRISPSVFTQEKDVNSLLNSLFKIANLS